MLRQGLVALVVLAAVPAAAEPPPPVVKDHRCEAAPPVRATGFRHKRSKLIAKAGSPNHRGVDLIASEDDTVQHIAGKLAYGKIDKDVEDEDVEVFACADHAWRSVGTARTDDDGRFRLTLAASARLAPGMRDLYVAVPADGTGAYFVGYVAARGEGVVVTDVDGTITWSENAILSAPIKSADIRPRPNAPTGFKASKHVVVYVTARGDVFTEITRRWLERHGFPRGVMRLSHGAFAPPGSKAIAYKTSILKSFTIPIIAGIGNRKSDIVAYSNVGVPAKRILIHLPQYEAEVRDALRAGKAIGFADYLKLPTLLP